MEYFNTVVVQPHRKLVTNQGRGYHVRCRYQSQERTLTNDFNVRFPWSGGASDRDGASGLGTTPLTATAAMPSSSMRIFYGEASEGLVAENVKIGDPLSLVISIDEQDIYGMHVTQCLVRDGLGWSEQGLINEEGCPQVPPVCENGVNIVRKKRQVVELDERNNDEYELVEREETIKVYSGLYVNEASDLEDDEFAESLDQPDVSVYDPNTFCISQRSFAIGIAIAGLILMSAVVVAI